jgi:hypothetical protein
MTVFLRLLADRDKARNLLTSCEAFRLNVADARIFQVSPESFSAIPGTPFSYWCSANIRKQFSRHPPFLIDHRWPIRGGTTMDDFRYLRVTWEVESGYIATSRKGSELKKWVSFVKGGSFSRFYFNVHLAIKWFSDGKELKASISEYRGRKGWGYQWSAALNGYEFYFRPGLTWPLRTNGLSFRTIPRGCIFGHKGPVAFVADDTPGTLLTLLAIINSRAFGFLVSLQLARTKLAQSYEVGLIQQTPVPNIAPEQRLSLATLARRAWSLKRTLDTIDETSHAFALPGPLRTRLGDYDPPAIEAELTNIQATIDTIAFDLYGFTEEDRAAVEGANGIGSTDEGEDGEPDDADDEDAAAPADRADSLLSWATGVAFGRFDLRLATGERAAPPEPDPFDPLPARSPGMLPDGDAPFHAHPGSLVDDPGHPHDLAGLIEDVLARVDCPPPEDVRRWLQRDFFPFHLQRYSKSRRKAPIYWPLSTASGS